MSLHPCTSNLTEERNIKYMEKNLNIGKIKKHPRRQWLNFSISNAFITIVGQTQLLFLK